MGSMAGQLKEAWEQKTGAAWDEHQAEVADYWRRVREELLAHLEAKLGGPDVGFDRVRVYQDGLPVGGDQARRIVDEVAARGSENYRLVKMLLQRGAQIEETERADLLKQEYDLVKDALGAEPSSGAGRRQQRHQERAAALLHERDEFIARAIDRTLREGEIGVLFIGALHQIRPKLPPDVTVTLLPRS